MKVKLAIIGATDKSLIIEPWGEEFDIGRGHVEIIFSSIKAEPECKIELDCSEEGFFRIENPSGFRPVVLIDGHEDERPAFRQS